MRFFRLLNAFNIPCFKGFSGVLIKFGLTRISLYFHLYNGNIFCITRRIYFRTGGYFESETIVGAAFGIALCRNGALRRRHPVTGQHRRQRRCRRPARRERPARRTGGFAIL